MEWFCFNVQGVKGQSGKKLSSKLEGTNASTKTNDTLEKKPWYSALKWHPESDCT